ncbi:IclR family transcriptional regulator [Mesorhizobium sp. BHbdii]
MKTLDTALDILRLFITIETLSVGDVCLATGLPKSKVSKLLAVFRDQNMLEQDPTTRRYKVGITAFELGSRYPKSSALARDALPVLRRIMESSGLSSTMSVMNRDIVLHLMAVEGPLYAEGHWRVGNRLPAHATSAGKVLLAGLAKQELRGFLDRNPMTPITAATVTDPVVLTDQLEEIRQSGFCVSNGESAPGLVAVAAPVLGGDGKVTAAIGFVLPLDVFDPAKIPAWVAMLQEGGRDLSMKLGAPAYPYGNAPTQPRSTGKTLRTA